MRACSLAWCATTRAASPIVRGYADKYAGLGGEVYLTGVEFRSETRRIVGFEVEVA